MGNAVEGDQCYGKVLVTGYSEGVESRLGRALIDMMKDMIGFDLGNPHEIARPGDVISIPGGHTEQIEGGSDEDEANLQDLAKMIETPPEWNEVGEKVSQLHELYKMYNAATKEFTESAKTADDNFAAGFEPDDDREEFLTTASKVLARVYQSIECEWVDTPDDACKAVERTAKRARMLLDVTEEGHEEGAQEALEYLQSLDKGAQDGRLNKEYVKGIIEGMFIPEPAEGWELVLDSKLQAAAGPLLERLTGSSEVTVEAFEKALTALGPEPEF